MMSESQKCFLKPKGPLWLEGKEEVRKKNASEKTRKEKLEKIEDAARFKKRKRSQGKKLLTDTKKGISNQEKIQILKE